MRVGQVGFITMAFGPDKYLRQAETLARSLKLHMPGHPRALVTDRPGPHPLFDIVVPMRPVAAAGTVHKTEIYGYSPFDETLFIDSDCVVARSFTRELAEISRFDFSPIVGLYLVAGDADLWLEDVGRALAGVGGRRFAKFNGGVYFFRKGPFAKQVFDRAGALRGRAAELGIKDFDRSGPGEETLIGLALAEMHAGDSYNDGGALMRTPLNSTGPLTLDVLAGDCHFIKEGTRVDPAICHFCGPWIEHRAYLTAEYTLLHDRRPPPVWRARLLARDVARRVARKVAQIAS